MSALEKIPHDFVFVGKVYTDKKKMYVAVRKILADGALSDEPFYYEAKRGRSFIVGGVYTGAAFDTEGSVSNLDNAKYARRWPDVDAIREWQIADQQAETDKKRDTIEKDEGRVSELQKILLPLRRDHAKLVARYVRSDVRAFEEAVLDALRTPPRASE